jgi:hypothetical protein
MMQLQGIWGVGKIGPFRTTSTRPFQSPCFLPQAAGFRQAAVHIKKLKKMI